MTTSQNISNSANQPQPPDWDPFEVGQILDDKYKVVSLLGKGGMGAVYRVTQLLLHVDVAFKTLNTQKQNDASSLRRFQTEARAAFSLKHPNLVNIHDFGVLQNSYPFIVMELIEGITLQQFMQQRGPLPPVDIQAIFVRLCFALSYAHQNGIVHRDIKPGNIMLKRGVPLNDESCVKILDFGLAKIMNTLNVDIESLTKTGDVIGSPLYMSPEQCSGAPLDHRSDVYSLGCVLFEALTGTPPLVGANSLRTMMLHQTSTAPSLKEAALGRDFPPALEQIVAKMLAKSPADRYSDLGVTAMELSAVCTGKELPSIALTTSTIPPKLPIRTSEHRVPFTWMQFCLLIFITIFISTLSGYLISLRNNPGVIKTPLLPTEVQAARDAKEISSKNNIPEVEDNLQRESAQTNLEARQIFLEAKPIIEVAGEKNGRPTRLINFPEHGIGDVEYSALGEGSPKLKVAAEGDKNFPLKVPLTYHLSDRTQPAVVSNAFIFDKIDKNIFAGLNYVGSTELSADEKIGTFHLLRTVCQWSNLTDLCLSSTAITKEMAAVITPVTTLKRLLIRSCQVDPKDLFNAKFTKQLEQIDLVQLPADPVLAQLTGSKAVKALSLGEGCSVEPASLAILQTCPNLNSLVLTVKPMTDEQLSTILKIKSLTSLAIHKNGISGPQLENILAHGWTLTPVEMTNPNEIHTSFWKTTEKHLD